MRSALVLGICWWIQAVLPTVAQTNLPTLQILSSNANLTVFWPDSTYYSLLQSASSLAPDAVWSNEACASPLVASESVLDPDGVAPLATNLLGSEFALTVPGTGQTKFFRLKPPGCLPLCCFAIFYEGLLEFSQCPPMIVNGPVHADGPIFVGTSASINFNQTVTTADSISAPLVDGISSGWTPENPGTWNAFFNSTPALLTNIQPFSFTGYGTNNLHFMIEIPPPGEDPSSFVGSARLFNEASMILLITNGIGGNTNPTVQVRLQASINGAIPAKDPAPLVLTYTNVTPALLKSNLAFLVLTNKCYDQRESKTNLMTLINVGALEDWYSTNLSYQIKFGPNPDAPEILYVADQRNHSAHEMTVVFLANAAQLPANDGLGFTGATLNPLYVWGNYNIQIDNSGNQSLRTTNTTYTVPAALISDALTILSSNWMPTQSYFVYNPASSTFDAATTTLNAAIVTGNMPSTGTSGTTFSGGVHNLPRLLEDWSAKELWLNTSLIRLWSSQLATNQFRNPAGFSPSPVNPYYNPPMRQFAFDQNFLNPAKMPPGIPMIYSDH